MNIIKFYISNIILLVSISSVSAQQGSSNPFEIQGREVSDTINVSILSSIDTNSRIENAFEVYREGEETRVQSSKSINDGNGEDFEVFETVIDSEIDTSRESETILKGTDNNPFEISHIPYRASELKTQANTTEKPIPTHTPNNSETKREYSNNTFIFWMILFSLLLLAIVINVQRSALARILKSITNENILKLNRREEKGGVSGHYLMLYVIFFINMACFIYLVAKHYISISGVVNWFYIFLGIVLVYFIRHIFMSLLGWVFGISKDSGLYSFTILTFNLFLGLVLIPINMVVAFSPPQISLGTIYVGIGLITILLLIRVARGVFIGASYVGEHIFQFFIYLCAFEIAPVLILLRIING